LLEGARDSVRDAIEMTTKKEALDFIEVDIKKTWELLGEINSDGKYVAIATQIININGNTKADKTKKFFLIKFII
jgi:hypothetical protein